MTTMIESLSLFFGDIDMLFNSIQFLVFFPIVVLMFFIIPRKLRSIWLLLASYFFYMCWNPLYILLILFSTVVTWISGRLIGGAESDRGKREKWIVGICFFLNLSILAFYKYADFLLQNINAVLHLFSAQQLTKPFDILLPVGISFYTFQALGYTVDVYRKTVEPEKNLLQYALFVSFFPQLVAGPIERTANLMKDIKDIPNKKPEYDRIVQGLIMMLYGMFLKLMIADRVVHVVDYVFDNAEKMDSLQLFVGAIGFTLQIYCDFAGYSTIAIGAAKVLGFTLMENFNTPYLAESIKEFWRDWHISLSTWFRDYLYIPLGGNRCSKARQRFNLMVTFLVSGLWHGAGWHFVAWGGLHGLYQIIGDLLKAPRTKIREILHIRENAVLYRLGKKMITFLLVAYAWIYFRAKDIGSALRFSGKMFSCRISAGSFGRLCDMETVGMDEMEWMILGISLVILMIFSIIKKRSSLTPDQFIFRQKLPIRWAILYLLLFGVMIFGIYGPNYDQQAFIYFQF